MKFQAENLLYLALFALIPWIVYLFQIFSGSKKKLPSLIFIQEASKTKISAKRRFLIYFLQSLSLLFAAFAASSPYLPESKDKYFCVVDDLIRTQWNENKWEMVENKLKDFCSDKFYSLTSLSQNRLEFITKNMMQRNEIIYIKKTLNYWLDSIETKKILLIFPEDNYIEGLENMEQKTVEVYPVAIKDKKNKYFEKVTVSLHPLDYRKRELYIRANMPFGRESQVVIEREGEKTSVSLDENAELRTLLDVNFSKEKEKLRIYLQGDAFYEDNEAFEIIIREGPYDFEYASAGAPDTIKSIIELDKKKFPFQWFQKRENYKKIKIGFSRDYKFQKDSVLFITGALRKGHRYLETPVDSNSLAWQKMFIKETFDIIQTSAASSVMERFSDGSAAVLKALDESGGLFLYNPDSAEEELKTSIAYPIRLLTVIINLISKEPIIAAHTESERNILFHDTQNTAFVPQVLEKKENDSKTVNVILKRHPAASFLSGKKYPESILFKQKETSSKNDLRTLFLSLFLIFITAVFWLDRRYVER